MDTITVNSTILLGHIVKELRPYIAANGAAGGFVICLSAEQDVLDIRECSRIPAPVEVIASALETGASGVIVAGRELSSEDSRREMTQDCTLFGIALCEHVVVESSNEIFSYRLGTRLSL